MHIQFTKTFEDLGTTYHAGEKKHCATSVAERYIDAKVAVPVKYASAAERLSELEAQRVAAIPESQRESAAPVWTVRRLPSSEKLVVGCKQMTSDLVYGPTVLEGGATDNKSFVKNLTLAGCPKNVIDAWLKAVSQPDYLYMERQRIEADKRAHAEMREREKHQIRFL